MRRSAPALFVAAALALPAYAEGPQTQSSLALIAPTAPTVANNNQIATTAWVNNLIASGLTLASGKIWIGSAGNIATPQTPSGDCTLSLSGVITCTQAAANFNVIGNLTVGGSIIDGNGILFTNIVAPATPAAGTTRAYVDSTTKTLSAKNDAGAVSNTVVASLAVANQFMTGISSAGVITRAQPAVADISGFGTGVATALGVNVGTAGSPVVNGGVLGTPSSGVATNLTGTASGLTAGTVTTNANLTGPVTSVGNATSIGANQVTRAMEAQGVARSVVGVTGNATANVADIQGTANQALVVNSAGTALSFGQINLASSAAVTAALPFANGGTNDTGTAPGTFTPAPTCGTATFTVTSAKSKLLAAKVTFIELNIALSVLGTCSAASFTITLPSTPNSSGVIPGAEIGTYGVAALCKVNSGSTTATCQIFASGSLLTATSNIIASGTYENQ